MTLLCSRVDTLCCSLSWINKRYKSVTLSIVHIVMDGVGSGPDAGGDGAEECGDWLSYMVSDFRQIQIHLQHQYRAPWHFHLAGLLQQFYPFSNTAMYTDVDSVCLFFCWTYIWNIQTVIVEVVLPHTCIHAYSSRWPLLLFSGPVNGGSYGTVTVLL